MKKTISLLLVLSLFIFKQLNAQSCNTVDVLNLSTGRDAITGTIIPNGSPDPNWIITALTPLCAALPGSVGVGGNAIVCGSAWTLNSPTAEWISFLSACSYTPPANQDTFAYAFTAERTFRVCERDSFWINFNFANDNFCTDISINGTSIFGPQPAAVTPTNYTTFTPVNAVMILGPGTHTISVTVHNFPVPTTNPHGFILDGNITSLTGNASLVDPSSSPQCECISYSCNDTCYWKVDGNNIMGGRNEFGTITDDDVDIITSNTDRGIFTRKGLLGWNTMNPTAYLHVDCIGNNDEGSGMSDIRFENLEHGRGNILVIDEKGYVFDSKIKLEGIAVEVASIKSENKMLRNEIDDLNRKIDILINQVNNGNYSELKTNFLDQNYPNPFELSTSIPYYISHYQKDAQISIVDIHGKEIINYPIKQTGKGIIIIDTSILKAAGNYTYSLIIDGKVIDTKKMTFIR